MSALASDPGAIIISRDFPSKISPTMLQLCLIHFFFSTENPKTRLTALKELFTKQCSSRDRAHVHLYKSNLHFSKRLKTFHHLALALDASASPDTQPVPCVIIQPPKISNLPQNSFQPVTTKKEVPTENKRQHSQQSVLDDFFLKKMDGDMLSEK